MRVDLVLCNLYLVIGDQTSLSDRRELGIMMVRPTLRVVLLIRKMMHALLSRRLSSLEEKEGRNSSGEA
jgi:hypothetical protein